MINKKKKNRENFKHNNEQTKIKNKRINSSTDEEKEDNNSRSSHPMGKKDTRK